MLETIEKQDNKILLISEKEQQVFLPYTLKELEDYLDHFEGIIITDKNAKNVEGNTIGLNDYIAVVKDKTTKVIKKEFVLPLAYYISYPAFSRFREAYSLSRDREAKPFLESLRYGIEMMFYDKLNPAIIAACKTQEQLSNYIDCLENDKLNDFTDFEIRFEVNPL